jgi:hypothetical protein
MAGHGAVDGSEMRTVHLDTRKYWNLQELAGRG